MMNLDDQLLEHPKFIRAVRLGGSSAVHLWLGLRAFCAQKLTDGYIEPDMLDVPRGPAGRARVNSLAALQAVGLVHGPAERAACPECRSPPHADSGIWMHDYLQWSSSRDETIERRRARSAAGAAGGSRSTEAKRTAALAREEHKRLPQANVVVAPQSLVVQTTTLSDPSHTIPIQAGAGERAGARAEPPERPAAAALPITTSPTGGGKSPENPRNRQEAEALGACAAAEYLQSHPNAGSYLEPQRWSAVVAVADALTDAAGRPRRPLGAYPSDKGVVRVVELLAAGHLPSTLVSVARTLPTREWWSRAGTPKGLDSLTHSVVERELAQQREDAGEGPGLTRAAGDLLAASGWKPRSAP